jgi:hypothetical protein
MTDGGASNASAQDQKFGVGGHASSGFGAMVAKGLARKTTACRQVATSRLFPPGFG